MRLPPLSHSTSNGDHAPQVHPFLLFLTTSGMSRSSETSARAAEGVMSHTIDSALHHNNTQHPLLKSHLHALTKRLSASSTSHPSSRHRSQDNDDPHRFDRAHVSGRVLGHAGCGFFRGIVVAALDLPSTRECCRSFVRTSRFARCDCEV